MHMDQNREPSWRSLWVGILMLAIALISFWYSITLLESSVKDITEEQFRFIGHLKLLTSSVIAFSMLAVRRQTTLAVFLNLLYCAFIILILLIYYDNILILNKLSFTTLVTSAITSVAALLQITKVARDGIRTSFGSFSFQIKALMITSFLGILSTELLLRASGQEPGKFKNKYFTEVDQLKVYPDIYSDESGIQSFTSSTAKTVSELVSMKQLSKVDSLNWADLSSGPYHTIRAFRDCRDDVAETEFADFMKELAINIDLDPIDSALIHYYDNPLNSNGFRSIEFKNHRTSKPKVLLLGDSFTWGWNASNYTNSFADRLSAMGYAVYNSGISATDPAQYQAVAEKYVAIIRPDIVIMNFYMANDVVYHHREARPHQIYSWETNAGVFYSFPSGKYISSADSAYQYVAKANSIPATDSKWFNQIMASSVITTRIWNALAQLGLGYFLLDDPNKIPRPETPCVDQHAMAINEVCDEFDASLLISIIPDHTKLEDDSYKTLFGEIKPVKVGGLIDGQYNLEDGHFNDDGHAHYAKFLATQIDSIVAQP